MEDREEEMRGEEERGDNSRDGWRIGLTFQSTYTVAVTLK